MPSADGRGGVCVCVCRGGIVKMMHYRHLEQNKWRSERESEPLGERLHRLQINADISVILPVKIQQVLLAVFVPVSLLARSRALAVFPQITCGY